MCPHADRLTAQVAQTGLIKTQIADNNRTIAKIYNSEEADLGFRIIIYGSIEMPLSIDRLFLRG